MPARGAGATSMRSGSSARSPAPKPRVWSTTTPRPRLLTLTALAAGREVIVSRGELVEIGGGFRVPDVMKQSGAVLREVGTTNRTRAADYAAAISDATALILRVHPSNFTIEGFTERPRIEELVALGRRFTIPVVEDLGSGWLGAPAIDALRDEPSVTGTIQSGADIVMFSGDKLLGGPQAGIIAGRQALVERIRRHPLMRALRVDKMTYAALDATLQAHATERWDLIPVVRMITTSVEEIGRRADALAAALTAAGSGRTLSTANQQSAAVARREPLSPRASCNSSIRHCRQASSKSACANSSRRSSSESFRSASCSTCERFFRSRIKCSSTQSREPGTRRHPARLTTDHCLLTTRPLYQLNRRLNCVIRASRILRGVQVGRRRDDFPRRQRVAGVRPGCSAVVATKLTLSKTLKTSIRASIHVPLAGVDPLREAQVGSEVPRPFDDASELRPRAHAVQVLDAVRAAGRRKVLARSARCRSRSRSDASDRSGSAR